MIRLVLLLVALSVLEAMAATSDTVALVGLGGGSMQYRLFDGGQERNWHAIPLTFDRGSVVRSDGARIVVLGAISGTRPKALSVWESVNFGEWRLLRMFPSNTSAVFAAGDAYGAVECDGAACSVSFYRESGDATRRVALPSSVQLRAKAQPAWRVENRALVFDTKDSKIMEFSVDDGSLRALTNGAHPRISPDGSKLAFLRDGQIWIRDLNEDREIEIASGSIMAGKINQAHFWAQNGDALYVNWEVGHWFGDGYACTRIDLTTGKSERVWKAAIQCEAEIVLHDA